MITDIFDFEEMNKEAEIRKELNKHKKELKKISKELEASLEKQKEINKDYVDECEELKRKIEKLEIENKKLHCCGNCKYWRYKLLEEDYICKRNEEIQKTMECYKEKMDKCDYWELAE